MKWVPILVLRTLFQFFLLYILLDGVNIVFHHSTNHSSSVISTNRVREQNINLLLYAAHVYATVGGVYSHETSDINNSKTDSCHRSRVVGLNENILVHTNYLLLALNSSTSRSKGFMFPGGTNVAVLLTMVCSLLQLIRSFLLNCWVYFKPNI